MKRILFSLMLLIGLVIPPASGVVAQPTPSDQPYTSQITGDEIDLGSSGEISWIEDNFDYRETISFQEEYIWFTYGWSNFQLVLIDGPNDTETYHETTLNNMFQFYDSFDLVAEEITDDHSWFLGDAMIDDEPLIVYYEFQLDAFGEVDMAFLQFTDITTFQEDFEFVQSEVTVGGAPLLPNTDAAELVARTGYEPDTADSSPEPEDDATTGTTRTTRERTDTPDDDEAGTTTVRSRSSRGGTDSTIADSADDEDAESTPRSSRTSRGGTDVTGDDTGNTSETRGTETDRTSRGGRLDTDTGTADTASGEDLSTPVAGGNWDELGLVSDTEWVSPAYGTTVTWDAATWEFPEDYEWAIVVNEDPPYDILTLQTVDGLGYAYVTIDLQYEATPRSLIDYWTSDDYSAQIINPITVLDTGTTANSATMVYETTDADDLLLIVVLEGSFMDDGTIVFSQISAAPETIHEVYASYIDGVEIDGQPLETTFTVEDIQEISGN